MYTRFNKLQKHTAYIRALLEENNYNKLQRYNLYLLSSNIILVAGLLRYIKEMEFSILGKWKLQVSSAIFQRTAALRSVALYGNELPYKNPYLGPETFVVTQYHTSIEPMQITAHIQWYKNRLTLAGFYYTYQKHTSENVVVLQLAADDNPIYYSGIIGLCGALYAKGSDTSSILALLADIQVPNNIINQIQNILLTFPELNLQRTPYETNSN